MTHHESLPPWEHPGAVRRDLTPHRAEGLFSLANVAAVLGFLNVCAFVPGIVSLAVAGMTIHMAKGDLQRMRQGLFDPSGEEQTTRALARADFAVLLTLGIIAASSTTAMLMGLCVYCAG
ncbi:MAG: hypothetical protein K2R98_07185 [Gemmataceae bacterium]|nr:hypothetical protein [Gemmataceae bacterium]